MKVYYLSLKEDTPCKGYWDFAYLDELLAPFESEEIRSVPADLKFGIFVIPARSHADADTVMKLRRQLARVKRKVIFFMGDEERIFPVHLFMSPYTVIWVQNPRPATDGTYRLLGCGYTPHVYALNSEIPIKIDDFFFSGQITHARREEMAKHLRDKKNGTLIETVGFTQGVPQADYCELMAAAKVVPCPSGPETPDTFRLFEALELGCVPIADTETAKMNWSGFWEWLFSGPVPFPLISNYESLPGYIDDCVAKYPVLNNRVQSWWFRQKAKMSHFLADDIAQVSGQETRHPITVIVPVSPIPSHPSIDILEETISTIRHHLPHSEIILTFDGVRPEQESEKSDYEEHIRRALWRSRSWGKITPFIFDTHIHQSGMMRIALENVKTPLVMYVEQDTPIVTDEPIDWELIQEAILSGKSNVVRLHHEGIIPAEHKDLMIGTPENGLLKTVQWSQRPHIASTAFYRRIMAEHFSDKACCFIEDLVHGRLMEAFNIDGVMGWEQWRTHIYFPSESNIKRSYHTNGRAGSHKYDDQQIW